MEANVACLADTKFILKQKGVQNLASGNRK